MKFKARDYQKECLAEISKTVQAGEKRALVVMAPGLGKTITSAFAIKDFFAGREFGRVLMLCHSEKILRQSKAKYQDFFGEEYSYGMYVNNDKATHQTDFLFATFQTMKENRKDFPRDAFSYIVVDEAHHSKALTYFPTIRYFKPKFLLGLTATPDRLDGQKIEEIYGEPVYELGFIEAECRGLLAECDYELVLDDLSQDDIDRYLDSDEKLSINQLNNTIFAPKRDEEIVRLIKKYSTEQEDPKTMIFCKSIEHARRIAKLMGDEATLVHNGQSDLTNDIALDAFREGKIQTIVSVQMLNEGIDVPDANVIVFLRNTVSPGVFYQQLGRGVRLSPGKKKVKVLDFVGNCERIQTVLELKQEIDDFRIQTPVEKTYTHGDGEADSHENFTLNIATPEFKSWMVDIVEVLGRVKHVHIWTREEILTIMRKRIADGKDVSVGALDMDPGSPCAATCARIFGSFNTMLEELGIAKRGPKTDERLVLEYYRACQEASQWLSSTDIGQNKSLSTYSTYKKRFGSMENLKQAVVDLYGVEGCECLNNTADKGACKIQVQYDKYEELLREYYEASLDAGHWLSFREIAGHRNLALTRTYRRYIGSCPELQQRAKDRYGDFCN